MINVLYIISNYPTLSETFIQREIEALKRKGVKVYIFALKTTSSNEKNTKNILYRKDVSIRNIIHNFTGYFLTNPFRLILSYMNLINYLKSPLYLIKLLRNSFYVFSLLELSKKLEIKIIHSHFSDMATDLALVFNLLLGIPFTFSTHARDFFSFSINLQQKVKKANAIFSCSHYLTRELEKNTNAYNIYSNYHGLDLNNPKFEDIYQNHLQNIKQNNHSYGAIRILAIGRLVQKKGFHVLLEALNKLKKTNLKITCKIIGSGIENKTLNKIIEIRHLEKHVRIIGALPFDDILKEFRKSNLLIVPSIIDKQNDRDNIPNVILEAQLLGIPVLATDLPSIKEVIEHKVTGFITLQGNVDRLAESIIEVYEFNRIDSIIKNAKRQVIEKFNINNNVERMIDVWNKTIST